METHSEEDGSVLSLSWRAKASCRFGQHKCTSISLLWTSMNSKFSGSFTLLRWPAILNVFMYLYSKTLNIVKMEHYVPFLIKVGSNLSSNGNLTAGKQYRTLPQLRSTEHYGFKILFFFCNFCLFPCFYFLPDRRMWLSLYEDIKKCLLVL